MSFSGKVAEIEGVKPEEWQRFAPFTAFFSVVKLWAGIAVFLLAFGRDLIEEGAERIRDVWVHIGWEILGWALLALVVFSIVSVAVGAVLWFTTRFALVADGIHVHKGVLGKVHTHLRWDRVQSVKIETKFIARIFGYAQLTIDSGASSENDIAIGLLKRDECNSLRNSLLAAADLARSGQPVVVAPWRGVHSTVSLEDLNVAYRVDPRALVGSSVRSGSLLVGIASITLSIISLIYSARVNGTGLSVIPFVFLAIGFVWSGMKKLAKSWDTRIQFTADGIRSTAGAFGITQRTILPQRIVGISVTQPFLWRRKDWWKLEIAVVGEEIDFEKSDIVIMPVAKRHEVVLMMWALIADLGVEDQESLLAEAFEGEGDGRYFTNATSASRFLDPWGWKRNAYALTRNFLVMRWGKVFRRKVMLCPNGRFQGISTKSGPLQRRWDLASLTANIPALNLTLSITNMDREQINDLRQRFAEMGRASRAEGFRETLDHWRLRLGVVDNASR